MRAKFVKESLDEEMETHSRYKEGDVVKYLPYDKAEESGLKSYEKTSPKIGIIQKIRRKFMKGIEYIINGIMIPECCIIGLVNENMQMPFRNDGNKPITQHPPLDNPNYLGDCADDNKKKKKRKRRYGKK